MNISNTSVWSTASPQKKQINDVLPQVPVTAEFDTIVIGNNVNGLLTAYTLTKAGEKVLLIDENNNSYSSPFTATTVLTPFLEFNLTDLVEKFGEEKAKSIWSASQKTIAEIERLIEKENIDCDFQKCSAYMYAMNMNEVEILRDEYKTSKSLNFNNAKFRAINKIGMGELAYIEVENQAKLNIEKFTNGLKKVCRSLGIEFYKPYSYKIEEDEEGDSEKIYIVTNEARIQTDNIINTSNSNDSLTGFEDKFNTQKMYFIEALVPTNTLPEAIFISPADPFYTFIIEKKEDGDHITFSYKTTEQSDEDKYFRDIEESLEDIFPTKNYKVIYKWSENYITTKDKLPFVGHSPIYENELISTGLGNSTLLYSFLGAIINRDIILGSNNKLIDIFSIDRVSGTIDSIGKKLNDIFYSIKTKLLGQNENAYNQRSFGKEEYEDDKILTILKYKNISTKIPNFKKDSVQKSLKHL